MEYEYFIELPIVRHTHCNAQRLRDEGIKFVSRLPQTIICRIRVRLTRLLLLSKTRFSTMNSSQSREIDKKLLLIISSEFVTFFVGYRYFVFFLFKSGRCFAVVARCDTITVVTPFPQKKSASKREAPWRRERNHHLENAFDSVDSHSRLVTSLSGIN